MPTLILFKWRGSLWREWARSRPVVLAVGLVLATVGALAWRKRGRR